MRVLYCNCTFAEAIPPEVKREVLGKLSASGVAFDAVADLCEMSAHEHPMLEQVAAEDDVRIAACFPRAVRCLFEAAGAPLSEQRAELLNMRTQSSADVVSGLLPKGTEAGAGAVGTPEAPDLGVVLYEGPGSTPLADDERFELLSALLEAGYNVTSARCACALPDTDSSASLVLGKLAEHRPAAIAEADDSRRLCFEDISGLDPAAVLATANRTAELTGSPKPDGWKPWFPVIDRERCTNCKQCLSFCLFDVFGVDADDRIRVQNPANCKTDCPACSRVCPSVAIVFPKYADGPINGDLVREQDLRRKPVQVDLSALVAPGMPSALRARNKRARKRFSIERDQPAVEPLCACRRQQLQQELGIPDQALANMCAAARAAEPTEPDQHDPADQRPAPSEEEWGI